MRTASFSPPPLIDGLTNVPRCVMGSVAAGGLERTIGHLRALQALQTAAETIARLEAKDMVMYGSENRLEGVLRYLGNHYI